MAEDRAEVPSGAEEPVKGAPPPAEPAEDWANRYRYLLADFDNYRKRTDREREGISRQTRAQILRDLIPIYEAFQHARVASANAIPAVREGLEMLEQEWQRFFQREGVSPVAMIGSPFAPEEQEAVAESAATEDHPDGTIAEIVQQGYRFAGGLLRPAKIVVARTAPTGIEAAAPAEPSDPPSSGGAAP